MDRIPEPELMNEPEQALAYARADFDEPHARFVALYRERFGDTPGAGWVLDLGCGPGDITRRFALAFPGCRLHGVDGAPAMLRLGRADLGRAGLGERVTLMEGYLPGARLPRDRYDAVIANSLLHHLADPDALWQAVRTHGAHGAPVFIMDLMRPASRGQAQAMMDTYAAGEPQVLRRDFFQSLLAAYRPGEVRGQLDRAGLNTLSVE
ncbi:MAG TPA: class I SAM-dependent methyltransferase, partial [Gammaproteobacteria bacterium]|nr:class I SAM-dependent methyltransferase [Gammaproteobacteria bacterium]